MSQLGPIDLSPPVHIVEGAELRILSLREGESDVNQ